MIIIIIFLGSPGFIHRKRPRGDERHEIAIRPQKNKAEHR